MEEELLKILPDLKLAVAEGVEYAGGLFNRAVDYYIIINIIGIVLGVVLLIFTAVALYKMVKWFKKPGRDRELDGAWMFLMLPAGIGIILLVNCINNYVQLKYIPEIFILNLFK